jgi:EPS-associated MarR family transcriptional regulator
MTQQMLEDTHLKVLKLLEHNPRITQRQLASELGFSLGKVNYCLKALMNKGLVKASNFKTSSNKRAYVYVLTPRGLEEKARISVRFLKRKLQEHDALKLEIERLKREMGIE